jgi:hypothetical protein
MVYPEEGTEQDVSLNVLRSALLCAASGEKGRGGRVDG